MRAVVESAEQCWARLEPAWRECFVLAWESFRAGSVPVGAVLLDAGAAIVARGRSLWNEPGSADGPVSGSGIAHAEINALAALPPADYSDHVLYTTLEPCFLCTAALRYSHVGAVRYAAPDPLWYGIEQLPRLNHHVARRWTRREGPLGGPLQRWAAVLHIMSGLERGVSSIVDCHAEAMPDELRIARRLIGPRATALRAMTCAEGLGDVWGELTGQPSGREA